MKILYQEWIQTTQHQLKKSEHEWTTNKRVKILLTFKDYSYHVNGCEYNKKNKKIFGRLYKLIMNEQVVLKKQELTLELENLKCLKWVKENSLIKSYSKFITIINEMHSLEKTYTSYKRVRQILRSLLSTSRHMVAYITHAKDPNIMALGDLIES